MAKSKPIYRYYDPEHVHLRTLRIQKRSKLDLAQKSAIRIFVVLVFFLAEGALMWTFAESRITYSPVKAEVVSGIKPPKAEAKSNAKVIAPPKPTAYDMYLVVPKLFINAPVEPVGLTKEGDMATSDSLQRIAWYKDGPKPGEVGNAVLAGHFGNPKETGIFREIQKLQVGDVIEVRKANGKTYKYQVYKTDGYLVKDVPLQDLFGKTTEQHLNLVSCYGNWNNDTSSYDKRWIAYTKLVE